MIDMDPELRNKLRAKYDRIKAESPPASLANFDPLVARPHRKVLNLMIGQLPLPLLRLASQPLRCNSAAVPTLRLRRPRPQRQPRAVTNRSRKAFRG